MKKLVKESLQEYLNEEEVFKGQIETGLSIDDVDKKEFLVGLAVEKKKHSDNLSVQKELVLQNLAKNPKYYSEGMKKGMFSDPLAINTYKKYFIDKEEVKESLNEVMHAEPDAVYDYTHPEEEIVETYRYCGFNVKVAKISADNFDNFGNLYYAIADIGKPLLYPPHTYNEPFKAKQEIEKIIDKYNEEYLK